MATEEAASAAKERHSARLLSRDGVSGVGTTRRGGEWAVTVHVDPGADVADLPIELDGVPVHVVRSGPFHAGPAKGS